MDFEEYRRSLPAWFHIGPDRKMKHHTNTKVAKCLRENHGVNTVGDLEDFGISRENEEHKTKRYPNSTKIRPCGCADCEADRRRGCTDPHKCLRRAKIILAHILPKWHPQTQGNDDTLDLSKEDVEANETARANKQPVTFNPDVHCQGNLSQGVRVFGDPNAKINYPPFRQRGNLDEQDEITVYTDGSCLNNGDDNARAGSGIWFGPDDERNKSLRVPSAMPQTNQTGEVLAIWYIATTAPLSAPLHIKSD
ncbi:uncharacterized protein STEHIDRAFT_57307, partial [Stereum hirsutum FP-91666 SS1]|uniref:uncharacterized protein n=1 Tax=Stereum hirsutum (strain FP-91666) TaxID=721885 RepID=UPI000440F09C